MGTDLLFGATGAIVRGVFVCVLYAALPPEAQNVHFSSKTSVAVHAKLFYPQNIAETSGCIEWKIRNVIDCGKCKSRNYNSANWNGKRYLTVADVSKAQANQRSGRRWTSQEWTFLLSFIIQNWHFDELHETTAPGN